MAERGGRLMRTVVIASDADASGGAAAASVALRTRASGPVCVIGRPDFPRPTIAPLPTPGALRAAASLRGAGIRATARWRMVVCCVESSAELEDAQLAASELCGGFVTLASGCDPQLSGYDIAVAAVPDGCPAAADDAALTAWSGTAAVITVLRLADPGHGRVLPLAGICPPPAWSIELDRLAVARCSHAGPP